MGRRDSPSSDRALQRFDDLAIVDFAEVAIVASDGEFALARDDDDGDVVAPPPDEIDRLRWSDGHRADDARRSRVSCVRDGALHGRRRRDTVVDDDDIPPLDRYRWRVAANAVVELARAYDLLFEERCHGAAIVFGSVRRDDGFAGS